jgi:general stress protein 26
MSIKFYIQSNELITELMAEMSKAEIRRFLTTGTYTVKLAAVKKEGSSHVAPIWFMLDYRKTGDNTGNIYFTTGSSSIKAKNIQRDKRVRLCIDYQIPLFSFVVIRGIAKIFPYRKRQVLKWATKIAERYVGKKNAKPYGERW